MTLFEKIYFTCLVLNIVFFIIGHAFEELYILKWYDYLLGFQLSLSIGYLIVKLILWMWGIHIDLFPSIKG